MSVLVNTKLGQIALSDLRELLALFLIPVAVFGPMFTGLDAEGSTIIRKAVILFVMGVATVVVVMDILLTLRVSNAALAGLMILFLIVYTISFGLNMERHWDWRPFIQIIMVFGWLNFLAGASWRSSFVILVCTVGVVVLGTNLVLWISMGLPEVFSGTAAHKNYLGSVCLVSLFFSLLALSQGQHVSVRLLSILLGSLSLILLAASGSRGAMLAVIVVAGTYLVWPVFARRRWMHNLAFVLLLIMLSSGMVLYLALELFDSFGAIQEFTLMASGSNVYTGRQVIWPILLAYIARQPWFGYGPGVEESSFLMAEGVDEDWSAHNLYLAILLQGGVVGLLVFLIVMFWIWNKYYASRNASAVRLSASFFVGCLVHQMFEVSLTQNNLIVGMGLWITIAVGFSRVGFSSTAVPLIFIPTSSVEDPARITPPSQLQ